MVAQIHEKCKIFIQFLCCFIHNIYSMIPLLYKYFIIVVLFTTI